MRNTEPHLTHPSPHPTALTTLTQTVKKRPQNSIDSFLTLPPIYSVEWHAMNHSIQDFLSDIVVKTCKYCSNSRVAGQDVFLVLSPKEIGSYGIQYLTHIFHPITLLRWHTFNMEARCNHLHPQGWQTSLPWEFISSDFSTLSGGKMLKRLSFPNLNHYLTRTDSQHRFRKQKSATLDQIPLTRKVIAGFNQQKPSISTILKAIDLPKTFDTVDQRLLLQSTLATKS